MHNISQSLVRIASFSPSTINFPYAWCGHIPFAAWIMQLLKPKKFVELGTHSGNSYFAFCQAVKEASLSTHCYAVDTWQGDIHAGRYSDVIYKAVLGHNRNHYSDFSTLLRKTFDEAIEDFADGSIDLLHIDGLHTYDAVKHDFETWRPKLAPGAVVLFHDTNVRAGDFGVWRLWEELCLRYPWHLEFTHSFGLGVLRVADLELPKELSWLEPSSVAQSQVIDYFSALGTHEIEKTELISTRKLLSERDAQLVERDAQLAERDAQILSILSSRSWRITSSLRFAGDVGRNVRNNFRLLRAFVNSYGVLNLFKKTLRVFQNEGFNGFCARLKQAGFWGNRNDYTGWVRKYDTLNNDARIHIRKSVSQMSSHPLISIIMPVFNPNLRYLKEAIESVQRQLYPYWELCIADDASSNPEIRLILENFANNDDRIKVTFRNQNGHISRASNTALALATGEFVALLDNDDVLPEHALFHVANVIIESPDVKLIYTDEDKITPNGDRYAPYFKCEFNHELFLAQNMISHLSVYHCELLKSLGGFRVGYEGAQDYDLALRVVEHLSPRQIKHIPKILYHWRAITGSTALGVNQKQYAVVAGRKAVADYFDRCGISARVLPCSEAHAYNRIRFELPKPAPLVSIVILTRDRVDLLATCIRSVFEKTTYSNFEIIIIDNGSIELATKDFFANLMSDRVRVVRDDSAFNFSTLNNLGVKNARGDILCLMNNDIEIISPDWLEEMVSFACHKDIGCVGARLLYPDGRVQHGGVVLGLGGVAGHSHKFSSKDSVGYFGRLAVHQNFSAVTAACLVVKREVYEQVGGLDESLAVAFNDVDFCLRVREKGYRNVWTPYAEMIHHESVSRGAEDSPEKQNRFNREISIMKNRWGDILLTDPAYSPNLTLDHEDFSLAWPPRVTTGLPKLFD